MRRVEPPDLVAARHRDVQCIAEREHVPGRAQRCLPALPALLQPAADLAGSRQRLDPPGSEVHRAHRVVAGVRHVKPVAGVREAVRRIDLRVAVGAVREPRLAAPDHRLHRRVIAPRVQPRHDDAVVARVGDEQPAAPLVGENLRGEPQPARPRHRLRLERQRGAIENAARLRVRDHLPYRGLELLGRDLARVLPDHAAFRIDQHQRGPRVDRVRTPDPVLPVVDDGVLDAQPIGRGRDVRRDALRDELARVDADDDQLVAEPTFQLPQLRK